MIKTFIRVRGRIIPILKKVAGYTNQKARSVAKKTSIAISPGGSRLHSRIKQTEAAFKKSEQAFFRKQVIKNDSYSSLSSERFSKNQAKRNLNRLKGFKSKIEKKRKRNAVISAVSAASVAGSVKYKKPGDQNVK